MKTTGAFRLFAVIALGLVAVVIYGQTPPAKSSYVLDYKGYAQDMRTDAEAASEESAFKLGGNPLLTTKLVDEDVSHHAFYKQQAPYEVVLSSDGRDWVYKTLVGGKLERVVLSTFDGIYDIHPGDEPQVVAYSPSPNGPQIGDLPLIKTTIEEFSQLVGQTSSSKPRTVSANSPATERAIGLPYLSTPVTAETNNMPTTSISTSGITLTIPSGERETWEFKNSSGSDKSEPSEIIHSSVDGANDQGVRPTKSTIHLTLASHQTSVPAAEFIPENYIKADAKLECQTDASYVLAKFEGNGKSIFEEITHRLPVDDKYGMTPSKDAPTSGGLIQNFVPSATSSTPNRGRTGVVIGVLLVGFTGLLYFRFAQARGKR